MRLPTWPAAAAAHAVFVARLAAGQDERAGREAAAFAGLDGERHGFRRFPQRRIERRRDREPDAPARLEGMTHYVERHVDAERHARLEGLRLGHVAAAIGEIEETIGDEVGGAGLGLTSLSLIASEAIGRSTLRVSATSGKPKLSKSSCSGSLSK